MVALSTRFAALALTLVVVDALPLPMNVEDAASGPSLFNAFHDHGDHHDKVVIVNGDHKHVEAKRSLVSIGGQSVDLLGDGLDVCIGSRCTRDQPQTSYLRSRIVGRNALVSERQLETPPVQEGAPSERHISSRILGRRAVDDVKPRADPGSGDREDYARRDQSKRYLGLNGLDAHVDALPVAEVEVVLPRSWSRVMRPILGARSNSAAQSSRRSDDSTSGVSGTIALMSPNGSGANMTQVASLALGDPSAEKLVFDASAVNSTEVTLKAVSSDSLMAANIDMDSLSSSRIPVTLSVSAFDSSKAMMKDLCTTFDPAPSTPVKFELEDCFNGSNPAHKSQLFTYDSNTGELQPLWQTQPASDAEDDTDEEDDDDDEKDSTDTQTQGGAVDPPTPKGGNLAVITDFAEDDYPVDASHPPMMAAAVMSRNGSTSSSSVGPKPSMASVAGTNGTAYSSSTNSSSASTASTNSTMHSSATNSSSASDPAPNTVNGQSVVLIFKPVAGLSVSKSSPVAAAAAAATTTTSQTAQSGSAAAMPTVSMVGAAGVSTSTVSTTSSSTTASASDNASGYDLEMVPVSGSATPTATMKSRRDDQDPVLPLPPAAATAASSTMRKRMHARDLVASSDVMPLAASTSSSSPTSTPTPMNRRHARDLMSSSVVSSSTAMVSAAATSGFMDMEDAEPPMSSSWWTRTAAASSTASPAMFTRAVMAPDSSSVEEYAAQMLTVNLPPPSPTSAPPTSAPSTAAPSTSASPTSAPLTSASSEPMASSSSMAMTSSATPEPTISSSTVADTVTTTSSEPAVTMEPPAGRRRSFRFSRNADV